MRGEGPDAELGEGADGLVEVVGVDVEGDAVTVDLRLVDAGDVGDAGGGALGLRDHRGAGQVPELGQRAGLHDAAGADDADAVRERLGLRQDVRAEQDGRPLVLELEDGLLELRLHQRVQSRGRLVEEVELRAAGQRSDQGDLLPVALGVGPCLLGRVELEALDHLGAPALVDPAPTSVVRAAHAGQDVDDLTPGEVGPQRDVAGDVRQSPVQVGGVVPRVAAQHRRRPGVGAQQPEQDADRRGLAGAVGAEEAVDLAGLDAEVEVVQRAGGSEGLDDVAELDDGHPPMVTQSSQDCEDC